MANYTRATNPDDPFGRAERQRRPSVDPAIARILEIASANNPSMQAPRNAGPAWYPSTTLDWNSRRDGPMGGNVQEIPLPAIRSTVGKSMFGPVKDSIMELRQKLSQGRQGNIPSDLGDRLRGMADSIRGIGQAARGGVGIPGGYGPAAMPSFEEIMAGIQASMAGQAPDAAEMARSQFAPQFDLLSQLRSQTTGRMNQQAQDAQAMYDALAGSIDADKSQVTQEYDTAAQNLDAAFGDAAASIGATGENSNAQANALMKRLGIQAAAPDVRGAIAEDQQRSANAIAELQANYAGNNEANRQSALDYITSQANTAGLAGANARADVEMALADALAGYDNQELALQGQQQAAENEYAMQIAGMQSDQQAAAMDQAWRQYQAAMDQNQWQQEFDWRRQTDQWDNEIARAAEERALRELITKSQQGPGDGKVDASTALLQEAAKYFPEDKANAVAYQLREALAANPQVETLPQFLQAIKARFPNNKDAAIYSHLATIFAQQLGMK